MTRLGQRWWMAVLIAGALACTGGDEGDDETDVDVDVNDRDRDGIDEDEDCDDDDPSVGRPEEGFKDADGDGLGAGEKISSCAGDVVDNDDDCDDEDASVRGPRKGFVDDDGDGYGAGAEVESCDALARTGDDCDDGEASIHPGAEEVCDGEDPVDYNCDGYVGAVDTDKDGFLACEECDDGDPTVNPDAEETWNNGIDDDCDLSTPDLPCADFDDWRIGNAVGSDVGQPALFTVPVPPKPGVYDFCVITHGWHEVLFQGEDQTIRAQDWVSQPDGTQTARLILEEGFDYGIVIVTGAPPPPDELPTPFQAVAAWTWLP